MGTKNLNSATDLITFTRASGGTALRKVGYGTELVTNGTFDTDITGWTHFYQSLSGSIMSWDNGALSFTRGSSSGQGALQAITVEPNKVYLLTGDVVSVTEGTGNFSIWNGGTFPTVQLVNAQIEAENSASLVFASGSNTQMYIYLNCGSSRTAVFDNISVKQIVYDRATDPLVLYNHPNNTPRIEYNADGTAKGLLIEEARTNSVTYSNDFSDSSWDKINVSPTASSTTSPDGLSNGWKLSTTGTPDCYLRIGGSRPSPTTYSLYVKKDISDYVVLGAGGGAKAFLINFSFTTGTIVDTFDYSDSTYETSTVENAGNGWYRISVTGNSTATNNFTVFPWTSATAPTNISSNSVGNGQSVYIYGAQTEESKSTPSSYIPTTGSTATRAADVASIPVTDFGYNSDAGSVYVDGTFLNGDTIVTLGSTTITADADGNKKYTTTYSSTPSATEIALNQGTYSDFKYYPRRLSNAQLQELTT